MCLEEGIACVKLDQDTANAPDVTWKRPAESENDLGRSVVPCRNNRRMIFVLECRRSEINESDLCIEEDLALRGLSTDSSGR